MTELIAAFWFFLPSGLANAMPVIVMHIPGLKKLDYPLDCFKTFRGIRIFGGHKSWRGLISGVITGLIVVYIQTAVYTTNQSIKDISWIKYDQVNPFVLGVLAGAGPLLGDAIKSFFKRRINIKPGATWFPFDQIDFILGGIVFLMPIIVLEWWRYLLVGIIWFALHPITTFLGWVVKVKDSPI